jgi:hypothetical protein
MFFYFTFLSFYFFKNFVCVCGIVIREEKRIKKERMTASNTHLTTNIQPIQCQIINYQVMVHNSGREDQHKEGYERVKGASRRVTQQTRGIKKKRI